MELDEGLTKEEITNLLEKLGQQLGFSTQRETYTGVSKVDLVWFENKIKQEWFSRPKRLEKTLLIPIVGFEIEEKAAIRFFVEI